MTLLSARLRRVTLIGKEAKPSTAHGRTAPAFTLPHPGHCSGLRTLTIVITDDSASLTSPGGNDPVSQRYQEARIAFRHLANACTCGQEFGAVAHFDRPSSGDVAPVSLAGWGLRRLERGLRVPRLAAGTSRLGPVLAEAKVIAEAFAADLVQLVVFSDFLLTDQDVDGVLADLDNFPGQVHAVVLTASPQKQLFSGTSVTVTPVGIDAESGDVARALLRSLTAHRLAAATSQIPRTTEL
ncbi:hypothetical protein ACQP1G_37045 [Nocardia sp. CA-107356]|uniref:hypothetical protein n=1 Tax=Nocardia sp. CA-107356 TaxID=3239972 RepID=UPI003D93BBE2